MKNIKRIKIALTAGVLLFFLASIAAAFGTANCVINMNKGTNLVKEFKNSLNDLKIRGNVL